MFNLKSGNGRDLTYESRDTDIVKALTASAFDELAKQIVLDSTIVYCHQLAADFCYQDKLETNDTIDDLYCPEEISEMRKDIITIVTKYHTLNPKGVCAQLTGIIDSVQIGMPISDSNLQNSNVQRIVGNINKFIGKTNTQNLEEILNLSVFDSLTDDQLLNTCQFPDQDLEIAVFEDDIVQCNCDKCNEIFDTHYDNEMNLNFIQKILVENYGFNK